MMGVYQQAHDGELIPQLLQRLLQQPTSHISQQGHFVHQIPCSRRSMQTQQLTAGSSFSYAVF